MDAGKYIGHVFEADGEDAELARNITHQMVSEALEYSDDGFSLSREDIPLAESIARISALRFVFGTSVMLMGGR
ncbi:MAG: hypothetical protein WCF85_18410 [Rhodospirillaceae bacterium]